jgi:phage baseplate assembly protein W
MPVERVSLGFRDISLSLKTNPLTRDIIDIKNETAIARSVQNLVLTINGERFFNPLVGSGVNRLLFENIDEFVADSIKTQIEISINNYEPRVELKSVEVTPNYDENKFDVVIVYTIVGIDALPQQLSFALLPTR